MQEAEKSFLGIRFAYVTNRTRWTGAWIDLWYPSWTRQKEAGSWCTLSEEDQDSAPQPSTIHQCNIRQQIISIISFLMSNKTCAIWNWHPVPHKMVNPTVKRVFRIFRKCANFFPQVSFLERLLEIHFWMESWSFFQLYRLHIVSFQNGRHPIFLLSYPFLLASSRNFQSTISHLADMLILMMVEINQRKRWDGICSISQAVWSTCFFCCNLLSMFSAVTNVWQNVQALVLQEGSFQHILRISNTNIDGRNKAMFAFTAIKGIGRRFSNILCKKADIDLNKRYGAPHSGPFLSALYSSFLSIFHFSLLFPCRAGELTNEEIDKVITILQHPRQFKIPNWMLNRQKDIKDGKYSQVYSNFLDTKLREDIERLKKIRAHRGLRHYWGLRVRGQHTKTTGKPNNIFESFSFQHSPSLLQNSSLHRMVTNSVQVVRDELLVSPKRREVKPGSRLSFQTHFGRARAANKAFETILLWLI